MKCYIHRSSAGWLQKEIQLSVWAGHLDQLQEEATVLTIEINWMILLHQHHQHLVSSLARTRTMIDVQFKISMFLRDHTYKINKKTKYPTTEHSIKKRYDQTGNIKTWTKNIPLLKIYLMSSNHRAIIDSVCTFTFDNTREESDYSNNHSNWNGRNFTDFSWKYIYDLKNLAS